MTFHLALRTLHLNRREKNHDIMMVLALSTKYFRTSYFQNCTFSEWTNQFLHIIGLENAKLDIFVPTPIDTMGSSRYFKAKLVERVK